MNNPHLEGANSALRSRHLWLGRFHLCEFDHLVSIEHNLYGRLVSLAETVAEPDLTDAKQRLLNLCILAFKPGFHEEAAACADLLMTTGLQDWPDDLFNAIDITGACHWQPVLRALLQRDNLPEALRWRLLDRWPDKAPFDVPAVPLRWSDALSGEIQVRVRFERPDWTHLLPEIRDSFIEDDRQNDLLWLVLGSWVEGKSTEAQALLDDWLAACPTSAEALCAATVSGDPGYNDTLQQGVLNKHIPPFWLAVHGQAHHLPFCVDLLRNPDFNKKTEAAWYGMTGQRLSRLPRADLGLTGIPEQSKERLADFRAAANWLEHNQPQGRLCLGQDHTDRPFRPQLGLFFGEWTQPAALSLWVDSGGKVFTRPGECHWRRVRPLVEVTA